MKPFCKIIMLPKGVQFLLIRSISHNQKPIITIMCPPPPKFANKLPGCLVYRFEYDNEAGRDKSFDEYGESNAMDFLIAQENQMQESSLILPGRQN